MATLVTTLDARLGSFALRRLLGTGGMSMVYEATRVHGADAEAVAVKVMRSELTAPRSYRENFMREVRSVARLNHPCIVTLYDVGEVNSEDVVPPADDVSVGSVYLVMELVRGETLRDTAERVDFLTLKGMLLDLLDALAHAHAKGIVHRDLKPGNVLVDRQARRPRLRLTDFGVARAFDELDPGDASEIEARISGTPKYMAPEQVLGQWRDQGPWTDLYSLGVMCWSLACGRAPFDGATREVMRDHLRRPLPAFVPQVPVPAGFESWLHKLLAKHPAKRFRRAADAAYGLLSLRGPAVFGRSPDEVEARSVVGVGEDLPTLVAIEPTAAAIVQDRADVLEREWPPPPVPSSWSRLVEPTVAQIHGAGLGLFGLRSVPVVGRRFERSALWGHLQQVSSARTPAAVALTGTRGVGKSKLLEWFATRAHELGSATVLHAHHSPQGSAGDGLGPMLARATNNVGLGAEIVRERLKELDEQMGEAAMEGDVDVIAELIAPRSDAARRRTRIEVFESLRRYLEFLAAERPIIVVLDDAQWGADSIELANHLLACSRAPILFVAAFSDEEGGEVASSLGAGVVEVPLGTLPRSDVAELVRQLLGVSDPLAERVADAAGGSPLYAVELAASWVEADALQVGDNGFELKPVASVELPEGLGALWLSRLDDVYRSFGSNEDAARAALEVAAVLGRHVDDGEWRLAARAMGFDLPDGLLNKLAQASIAVDTGRGWRFAHGLLADAVYEDLTRRADRLRALHAACTRTLDLLYRLSHDDRKLLRLARHAEASGQPNIAADALERATTIALKHGDLRALRAAIERRLALLPRLDQDRRSREELRVELWQARELMYVGQFDEALELAERAASAARDRGFTATSAFGANLVAMLLSNREPERARELYIEAADAFGRVDDDQGQAQSLCNSANILPSMGRIEEARLNVARAEQIAKRLDDESLRLEVEFEYGQIARAAGDLDEAVQHFNVVLTIAERIGWRQRFSDALGERADVFRMRGELERAERDLRRVIRLREASERRRWVSPISTSLSFVWNEVTPLRRGS